MRGSDTGVSRGDLVYSDFSLLFRTQFARRLLDDNCRLVGHPKTVIYTATSSHSFLLSQEVRFALRVVVKSSPLSALSTCGAGFHTTSSVQQSAPRLCTALITHKQTDHSQLKYPFTYLWRVLYFHPTCVTVSKHMAGRVITIRYLKCL